MIDICYRVDRDDGYHYSDEHFYVAEEMYNDACFPLNISKIEELCTEHFHNVHPLFPEDLKATFVSVNVVSINSGTYK